MFKKVKDKPYYTNNHSCFLLTAHLVLVTKYRKPVLKEKVKDYVYALIRETMESENIIIREMNGEADHIHILFDYAPDVRLSELINKIKSRTARLVRRDYPVEVGEYYLKSLFWTNSYFLGSVGSNTTEIVKEYIQNQ
ncbi:MAG: IS200/IS605 family transposase [Floccifex sp.]